MVKVLLYKPGGGLERGWRHGATALAVTVIAQGLEA
jgi:hypothetical protein